MRVHLRKSMQLCVGCIIAIPHVFGCNCTFAWQAHMFCQSWQKPRSVGFCSEGNPIKALPNVTSPDLESASGSSTDAVELAKIQNTATGAPGNAPENAAAGATTIGMLAAYDALL